MGLKGFFKGLAKGASFALPFVPIPGLAGNIGLSTAVRGALGAGLGAAAGGKKGALMGAASGAGGSLLKGALGGGGALKMPTESPLSSLASNLGGNRSAGGALRGLLGKLDPNMLALGGMSMLGDDGPQERKSFMGSGRTDPKFALGRAMQVNDELLQEIRNRVSSNNARGPVILPELPMQLGGGLGMDPSKRMMAQQVPNSPPRRKLENM